MVLRELQLISIIAEHFSQSPPLHYIIYVLLVCLLYLSLVDPCAAIPHRCIIVDSDIRPSTLLPRVVLINYVLNGGSHVHILFLLDLLPLFILSFLNLGILNHTRIVGLMLGLIKLI